LHRLLQFLSVMASRWGTWNGAHRESPLPRMQTIECINVSEHDKRIEFLANRKLLDVAYR
jgi:hypothetical protein